MMQGWYGREICVGGENSGLIKYQWSKESNLK